MSNRGFWRGRAWLAAALIAGACMGAPAFAQVSIVALVNNTPITTIEVSERRAIIRLTKRKEISAKQALDQLIDQHLLFQEATRRGITIPDSDVDPRINAIAANAKLTPEQLGKALAQAGASTRAFRAEIRAGLLRQKLSSMLSRLATGISEKEIAAGITAKKSDGGTVYRYEMQQIVFVTPKGASPALISQRRNEAENLRRRIKSCDQAISIAKELRDVATKPPVVRLSSQLPASFREQIGALKVGQSTKADPGELGVEIIVLCNKQETQDDTGLRAEVQKELIQEQGQAEVDKFVADLRKRALVIYK